MPYRFIIFLSIHHLLYSFVRRERECLGDDEGTLTHLFSMRKIPILETQKKSLPEEVRPPPAALRCYWQLFQRL